MAAHAHSPDAVPRDARPAPDLRPAFDSIATRESYPRGAILFRQGEPTRGLYLVTRGRLKLSLTDDSGRTATFRTAGAGCVLGLAPTLGGASHLFTAKAIESCEIAFVEGGRALELLRGDTGACFDAVQTLGKELLDLPPVVHKRSTRHRTHS
jgi:CRP-like cAMP-binding protein